MEQIYINARFLTQEVTGVQRFAIEISKQLKKSSFSSRICFVTPPNILQVELAKELDALTVGSNKGHLWEQVDLVKFLGSRGNPLLINLANSAPILYPNSFVTVHDLSVFYNPKWFSFPYRTYYQLLTPQIVKRAKLVFTVSNAMKTEMCDKFNIAPNKVKVIYNAVADKFLSTKEQKENHEKYILTVSSLDPRKNIRNLILAFNQALLQDHFLYIIGGENAAFSKTDLEKIVSSNSRIKLLGRVSDEQLLELYANATLFAYTSFYEGFGLPNIEAMAMGVPVLTSDVAAIREVCGDAAWYVNPNDIENISQGIQYLIHNPELLDELSSEGITRSKQYNWSESANKLYNAITNYL